MRPDFCASNSGRRPPWTRLWTRAEMNTVLPARDRPVTPSRSEGAENRPAARPDNVSSAMRASSVMVVSDDAKTGPFARGLAMRRLSDIGTARRLWNSSAGGRRQERVKMAAARRSLVEAVPEADDGEAGCREAGGQRVARLLLAVAGDGHGEIFH